MANVTNNIITRGHIHVIAENWTRALKCRLRMNWTRILSVRSRTVCHIMCNRESLQVVLTADSNDVQLQSLHALELNAVKSYEKSSLFAN